MTREEAIETLEEMIEWGDSYEVDYGACEMAIESLKQEPCEDCISRQAVLESIFDDDTEYTGSEICSMVRNLPHVKPQEPCEDTISRKVLISHIENQIREWGEDYDAHQILGDIEDMPSVTPKPKTGRWIKTPKAVMGEGYLWYCNKCEHQVYQDSSRDYPSEKYCPHCGARMESGDDK